MAQTQDLAGQLYYMYDNFKEPALTHRRIKHSDIQPLIEKLRDNPLFTISAAGTSAEGRSIYLVSAGTGKKRIFLWSQMHGDESTATMALFDLFRFLSADDHLNSYRQKILSEATIYFMPMVNPDGAEVFKRRNSFDIDINRDAARNTTPEGKVLKEIFDYLKADFGFNLHDQSIYYSAGKNPRSAAISFLAPAPDYSKSVDSVRLNAMHLIAQLNKVLGNFIPGHTARYSDDHEPRAFGDNFQKWGTSTILIETGGWKNDPEKQFLRKINFILLASAMFSIADGNYSQTDVEGYNAIPFNEELMKDLIIRNVIYEKNGIKILMDLSADRVEKPAEGENFYSSAIDDIGDLSVFFGYEDHDFSGYEIHPGKVYSDNIRIPEKLSSLDEEELLSQGYTSILYEGNLKKINNKYMMNIVSDPGFANDISIGRNASFYLTKEGRIDYVFINGFMYDVKNRINKLNNSIVK